MRNHSSLLAIVAASTAALAPAHALAGWTFTKSPAGFADRAIAANAPSVDALVFTVTATPAAPTRVTRMAFMVNGSVLGTGLANFQVVYYPNGPASPGQVVGTNPGWTWSPSGKLSSIVAVDLASPIDVRVDATTGVYTGVFALRVDVNGGPSTFFQPRLQRVTVESGGVEQNLTDTGDLPLVGDDHHLN